MEHIEPNAYIPPRYKKKMYICNRKKCDNCTDMCHHTSDINYAEDPDRGQFYLTGDYWWQIMIKETK